MYWVFPTQVQTHRYLYNVSNYWHQCDITMLYYNYEHLPSSSHWAIAISCIALVTSAQRRKIWPWCMFALLLQPILRLGQKPTALCHGRNLVFLYIHVVLQARTFEQFPRHACHTTDISVCRNWHAVVSYQLWFCPVATSYISYRRMRLLGTCTYNGITVKLHVHVHVYALHNEVCQIVRAIGWPHLWKYEITYSLPFRTSLWGACHVTIKMTDGNHIHKLLFRNRRSN